MRTRGKDILPVPTIPDMISGFKPAASNEYEKGRMQYKTDGAWLPAADPITIGVNNFSSLRNFRPVDGGIRPVLGYDNINTTALASGKKIRNGFQHITRYDATHVFVWTNDGYVYENTTAIPSQGDFSGTVWHTDASGFGTGRFSKAPNFNMTYCNGKESLIYAGSEMRIGGLFTMDDGAFDGAENPKDYSEIANDMLQTTGHYFSLGTQKFFLCLTTRKAKGFKFYVKTANDTTSTMTCKVYTGTWTAVSNPSDGTSAGGIALAQSGTFSFDSTVSTAIPFHYNGNYAFGYLFELSAGTADVYHVTVDCPPQVFCDIWDGTYETLTQFQVKFSGVWEDYTADVADIESFAFDPVGADIDGITSSDEIVLMSEVRLAGLKIKMAGNAVNEAASVMTVKYHTGSAWASASATDWTQNPAGDTLGQGGYVTWNPPAVTAEKPQELFGTYGYAYQITFSNTLTGTHGDATRDVVIEQCQGIPAQREVPIYKFCVPFKERLFGIGLTENNEGNAADYTPANMPDTWNGPESSQFGLQRLRADTNEDFIAATPIFNRFGNNIFMVMLMFTNNSTHVLSGDGPEDFKIEEIAPTIGCPAPLTLTSANIGFGMAEGVTRNVALWVSYSGPMMFDGSLMAPIKGIENYFDITSSNCVNHAYLSNARAWLDPNELIWHVTLPSGTGQVDCNVHLGYDLKRRDRGWFEYSYENAYVPQCGWIVKDTNGVSYSYGGIDSRYMIRMDYGKTWNGESIIYSFETGDFYPTNDIWDATTLRQFKLIAKRGEVDLDVDFYDCIDTNLYSVIDFEWWVDSDYEWYDDSDFTWVEEATSNLSAYSFTISVDADDNRRLFIGTKDLNYPARTHRIKAVINNTGLDDQFTVLGFGLLWYKEREDILAE